MFASQRGLQETKTSVPKEGRCKQSVHETWPEASFMGEWVNREKQVGKTRVWAFETRGGLVSVHGGLLYVLEGKGTSDSVAKEPLIV